MRIPGWGRVQIITRSVQNRIGATAVILLYHRVGEYPCDPLLLSVSPNYFEEQMKVLSSITRPVPLENVCDLLKQSKRHDQPLSAVTFDDGYVDNLSQAVPVLERYDIPATVFVSTSGLNHPQEFYWDTLERILLRSELPETLSLTIGQKSYVWRFADGMTDSSSWHVRLPPENAAQQAYLDLSRLLMHLSNDRRNDVIDQLFKWSGMSRSPREMYRTMTPEELCRLTNDGLITVGAHTVNHPVLSELKPQEQDVEINESRTKLQHVLDAEVRTFSYPYGRERDYTRQTVQLVRSAGFRYACSNFSRLSNGWTDPLQLPRTIPGNIDGEQFENMMSGVLGYSMNPAINT